MNHFEIGSRVRLNNPKAHDRYILPRDADQPFVVIAPPMGEKAYEIGVWVRSATGRTYLVVVYALIPTTDSVPVVQVPLAIAPASSSNAPRIDGKKKAVTFFVVGEEEPYCPSCAIEKGKNGAETFSSFHFGGSEIKCLGCREVIT